MNARNLPASLLVVEIGATLKCTLLPGTVALNAGASASIAHKYRADIKCECNGWTASTLSYFITSELQHSEAEPTVVKNLTIKR